MNFLRKRCRKAGFLGNYESIMKNQQQSKVSREIGTSYDADDEDVFPESTTEEDSDGLDLNEWARESEFESTDSDSSEQFVRRCEARFSTNRI